MADKQNKSQEPYRLSSAGDFWLVKELRLHENQLKELSKEVISLLSPLITDERLDKMKKVAQMRVFHVSLLLEDIYQEHNASAVLRSCDGLGFSNVHTLEQRNNLKLNTEIALGAEKWLVLNRMQASNQVTSQNQLEELKKKGLLIAATSLHERSIPISKLDLSKPTILVFGTELEGVTESTLECADIQVQLPMYGFTQSFNVSVSAALAMQTIRNEAEKIKMSNSPLKQESLIAYWLIRNLRYSKNTLKEKKIDSAMTESMLKEHLLYNHGQN